jgi:hypothetical protein
MNFLLNLVILVLIVINISLSSYALYKKVNESYMNGDYKSLMDAFKKSTEKEKKEEYSDIDGGEGYQDSRVELQGKLDNMYI